jgi:hypothetical protein
VKTGGAAEGPAVIVQRMIDAAAAGVAFSADPVSGRRGVVISAMAGLGEALVSGEVDGESWVVDTHASGPDRPEVLTANEAMEIADLARRAEAAFGAPQDIEWAIDGDGLHILQSRPITTPLLPAPNPDDALTIYDNSNIVESYPGMVSPLTYSFALHVYDAGLPGLRRPARVSSENDRGQFRRLRQHAGPGRRAGLLQPRELVSRAGAPARVLAEPQLHGNHDGRLRTASGGGDGGHRPTPARGLARMREYAEVGPGRRGSAVAGDTADPHPRAVLRPTRRGARTAASIQIRRGPPRSPPNTAGSKARFWTAGTRRSSTTSCA